MDERERLKKSRWPRIQMALTFLFYGLGVFALCGWERRDLVAVSLLAVSVLQICDIGITIQRFWKSKDKDLRTWFGWRIAGEVVWTLILVSNAQSLFQLDHMLRKLS